MDENFFSGVRETWIETEAEDLHNRAYAALYVSLARPPFKYADWMYPLVRLWRVYWLDGLWSSVSITADAAAGYDFRMELMRAYRAGWDGDLAAVESFLCITELRNES